MNPARDEQDTAVDALTAAIWGGGHGPLVRAS